MSLPQGEFVHHVEGPGLVNPQGVGDHLQVDVTYNYCKTKICHCRQLTKNIPFWAYYPRLGISNPQLGIIYLIDDWGFLSQVKQRQRKKCSILNCRKYPQLGIWNFPIGDIIPNSVFSSVSPLLCFTANKWTRKNCIHIFSKSCQ